MRGLGVSVIYMTVISTYQGSQETGSMGNGFNELICQDISVFNSPLEHVIEFSSKT